MVGSLVFCYLGICDSFIRALTLTGGGDAHADLGARQKQKAEVKTTAGGLYYCRT